ncbi:hypothetical protein [Macrococcus bovicus]|uniref:hypothetical protein n=1 Tax=Macrococcus bovicus TaxID=69968 RepID=UPI0025A552E1|nr:hypothetical protein [Macrococcus bovicus]WJP97784.1 hypothetical protein QSV55_11280 [Macrococcus bovicus]
MEEELKLKIIVGDSKYNNDIDTPTNSLVGMNCYNEFYKNFTTVAFIPNQVIPYKFTFQNILQLLNFKKQSNIQLLYTQIMNDPYQFIEDMFEKRIVFINQDEINEKNIKFIKNADYILACGENALNKVKKIVDTSKLFYAIHPSVRNAHWPRYIDDWINIKTTGILQHDNGTYHHRIKKDFML